MRATAWFGRIRRSIMRMVMAVSVIMVVRPTATGFPVSTTASRACGAIIRFTVGFRIGRRVRRGFIGRFADRTRFVVNAADYPGRQVMLVQYSTGSKSQTMVG